MGNQKQVATVNAKEIIGKVQSSFEEVIQESGLNLNWKKESSFALQTINDNPGLQKCSSGSLMKAVYNVALTGLSLNPKLAHCYLVPRGGKAVLDISYQGLIYLMTNQLNVNRIHSDVVYKNDEFDYYTDQQGTKLHHRPNVFGDRGELLGAYAIAYLNGGNECIAVVLSESEINAIKNTSQAAGSKFSPWSTFPNEMRKKTAVRRLWKLVPKTERIEQVANAIEVDNDNFDADFKKAPQKQQATATSFDEIMDVEAEEIEQVNE